MSLSVRQLEIFKFRRKKTQRNEKETHWGVRNRMGVSILGKYHSPQNSMCFKYSITFKARSLLYVSIGHVYTVYL